MHHPPESSQILFKRCQYDTLCHYSVYLYIRPLPIIYRIKTPSPAASKPPDRPSPSTHIPPSHS